MSGYSPIKKIIPFLCQFICGDTEISLFNLTLRWVRECNPGRVLVRTSNKMEVRFVIFVFQ